MTTDTEALPPLPERAEFEQIAAEGDEMNRKLIRFAEHVRDSTAVGSWLHAEACAALAEARKA